MEPKLNVSYSLEQYFIKKEKEYLRRIGDLEKQVEAKTAKCASCLLKRSTPVKEKLSFNETKESYGLYLFDDGQLTLIATIDRFETIKVKSVEERDTMATKATVSKATVSAELDKRRDKQKRDFREYAKRRLEGRRNNG